MDSNVFVPKIIKPFGFQLYRSKTVSDFLKQDLLLKFLMFEGWLELNFISFHIMMLNYGLIN